MTLPQLRRHDDAAALARGTAIWLGGMMAAAIESQGRVAIALSGGSSPRAMHAHLRQLTLPWDRVHVYFGDERCVPPDDPASNYKMACETLLDHVTTGSVARIEGELPPEEAARRYAATLEAGPPLDIVVLGMGDDGHVASLFPDTPEPAPGSQVIATRSPIAPHDRVTLTYEAIARARIVNLVVAGQSKATRLAEVYGQIRSERRKLPAARVRGASGAPWWLVDTSAASLIYEEGT